ncbi:MAG: hypothetical protein DRJ61_11680 [Acidobacteria bacterium]|nr:MAG: hypothetical protein DRJ61_11680 [Acidobacteriota bacterium]
MSRNRKWSFARYSAVIALVLGLSSPGIAGAENIDCGVYANYAGRLTPAIVEACTEQSADPPINNSDLRGPTDLGMGVDIYGDQLITWTLNNFPGYSVVAPSTVASFAMDFDITATTLWAMENSSLSLGTIDLATGAFTIFSPCAEPGGGDWSGLTVDPATGTFFASSVTALYVIDATSPAGCNPTLVGNFNTTGATVIDIAMNATGQMYAHDIVDDALYSVNPATGAATLVGPTGLDGNYAQGMDFDHSDGSLYAFLLTGAPVEYYGTFDLATGAFNIIYTNPALAEHEFGVQIPGVPVELQSFSVE